MENDQRARWQIKVPKGLAIGAFAGLTIWDAAKMAHDWKEQEWRDQYEWAPYVLEDDKGVFTLEKGEYLLSPGYTYYKTYVDESGEVLEKNRVEVEAEEFGELLEEAEALWGTFEENKDGEKEFVPGLLRPKLRKLNEL